MGVEVKCVLSFAHSITNRWAGWGEAPASETSETVTGIFLKVFILGYAAVFNEEVNNAFLYTLICNPNGLRFASLWWLVCIWSAVFNTSLTSPRLQDPFSLPVCVCVFVQRTLQPPYTHPRILSHPLPPWKYRIINVSLAIFIPMTPELHSMITPLFHLVQWNDD